MTESWRSSGLSKCEAKREQFRKDALAAWTHYQTTGLHVTAEEADAWLAKLEAGDEGSRPISIRQAIAGREHE